VSQGVRWSSGLGQIGPEEKKGGEWAAGKRGKLGQREGEGKRGPGLAVRIFPNLLFYLKTISNKTRQRRILNMKIVKYFILFGLKLFSTNSIMVFVKRRD
jgi:hypothetical protein